MLPGQVPLSVNADKIRAGEVTSVALVEQALDAAKRYDDSNYFTELDPSKALKQAEQIDAVAKNHKPIGKLVGVPVVVKDNIDTEGMITSAGSSAFAGWRPSKDAPIVAALKAEGAVILGKTNMHELAYGVTSNNAFYGPVRNPYDKTRISGGSSGGTAAAIAAEAGVDGFMAEAKPEDKLARIREAASVDENVPALAAFLDVPMEKAREIAASRYLYVD